MDREGRRGHHMRSEKFKQGVQELKTLSRFGHFFMSCLNSQLISDSVFPSLALLLVERIRWGTETGDYQQKERHAQSNSCSKNTHSLEVTIGFKTTMLPPFPVGEVWWHSKTARRTLQPDNQNIATKWTNLPWKQYQHVCLMFKQSSGVPVRLK